LTETGVISNGSLSRALRRGSGRRIQLDDLVSPGIVAEVGIERLSSLLLEVSVVELGSLGDDCLHPEGSVGLDQAVAELRGGEGLETLLASLQLLQVEAEVLLAVGEILDAEELESLLGGLEIISVGVLEGELGEGRLRWEEEAITEGKLGVNVVAEDDVR
jgi:hypothetical protein